MGKHTPNYNINMQVPNDFFSFKYVYTINIENGKEMHRNNPKKVQSGLC